MKMTSRRLKDKIRNIALSDSDKSQMLFRHYFFERFLFRLTQTDEKDCFVLKGGVLIASELGMDRRMTRDIDFTLQEPLSLSQLEAILSKAAQITCEDNTSFEIKLIEPIVKDRPNQGLRVHVNAQLEQIRNTFHIDITYGDVITPYPVRRRIPFMFDDGYLEIISYPIETVLAEKLSAIVELGRFTTRMRDYYDLALLYALYGEKISVDTLQKAIIRTCNNKNIYNMIEHYVNELHLICADPIMQALWHQYLESNKYEQISWTYAVRQVESVLKDTDFLRSCEQRDKKENELEIER